MAIPKKECEATDHDFFQVADTGNLSAHTLQQWPIVHNLTPKPPRFLCRKCGKKLEPWG